eukprot:261494-Amphidinium_carterae.1
MNVLQDARLRAQCFVILSITAGKNVLFRCMQPIWSNGDLVLEEGEDSAVDLEMLHLPRQSLNKNPTQVAATRPQLLHLGSSCFMFQELPVFTWCLES